MFHKTPNYTFSRSKGREISPTEARFNRILHRVSSIKNKGGSKQVCRSFVLLSIYILKAITITFQASASIMSQRAASQTETNEHVEGDNVITPNAIENTDPESSQVDAPHFGIFHNQVRDEVQRLQDGVAQVNSAATELSKTFSKYGKIVRTVGERFGKDQALEEEIRELKAESRGIWKHIEKDRTFYQKKISDLETKHDKELFALQARAKAGEQEKEKYEKMEKDLKDELDQTTQRMAKELEQKMTQLENANAEKIAGLERERQELKDAKLALSRN
jgi:hypothetical protein